MRGAVLFVSGAGDRARLLRSYGRCVRGGDWGGGGLRGGLPSLCMAAVV